MTVTGRLLQTLPAMGHRPSSPRGGSVFPGAASEAAGASEMAQATDTSWRVSSGSLKWWLVVWEIEPQLLLTQDGEGTP